jgi:hypothetical protein
MRRIWHSVQFAGGSAPLPAGDGTKQGLGARAEDGYLIEQFDETIVITLGLYDQRTQRVTIGPQSRWVAIPFVRCSNCTPRHGELSPSLPAKAGKGKDETPSTAVPARE